MSPLHSLIGKNFAVATTFPKISTEGLVLHLDAGQQNSYKGSETTWTDLSGNTNTGTLTGGINYSSNNGGYLTITDGVRYVSIAQTSVLTYPGDFTMESWFMITHQPDGTFPSAIFSAWDSGPLSTNSRFIVYVSSLYQLVAQLKGQNTDVIHQTSISLNTWYHVALVRSSSVFSTYLNTVPSTQTGTSSTNLTSVLDTLIGYYSSASGYSIKGRVAVYRVYNNRALTATEIMQNFNTIRGRFGV